MLRESPGKRARSRRRSVSRDKNSKQISIRVRDDFLECLEDDRELWRAPIDEILLIAEYSTNEGWWGDDYYLNLWSFENGELLKATIGDSVGNVDATFQALGQKLGAELQFGLMGKSEWASRVMWPPELAGHPYFTFRKLKPASWREKLRHRFFGSTLEYFLTEEVQTFLHRSKSQQ